LNGNGTDTLTAGAGTGTQSLFGVQGDTFTSAAGAAGNNAFWVEAGAGAGSSLTGGSGNDTFHIETKAGNDTITGGGGTDTVGFGGRSEGDIQNLTGSAGNFELTFNDGQTIDLHGVSDLFFGSDGQTIVLPH
jgi:Ca2+-binding RTX toxin-like protein